MNSISPGKDGDLKDVLSRRNDVFALPELGEWKQEVLELFRVLAFTQQTSADSILKRLIGTV